jgi:hypothetical protein
MDKIFLNKAGSATKKCVQLRENEPSPNPPNPRKKADPIKLKDLRK